MIVFSFIEGFSYGFVLGFIRELSKKIFAAITFITVLLFLVCLWLLPDPILFEQTVSSFVFSWNFAAFFFGSLLGSLCGEDTCKELKSEF